MSPSRHIPATLRRAVYIRDGHRCVYCGVSEPQLQAVRHKWAPPMCYRLTIDHLIPRSLGGPDEEWNLATACHHCNTSRQEKTTEASMALLIRRVEVAAI